MIDDSYKWPKPMEIVMGKKFKLEVWEIILKSMREGEISKFIVNKSVSIKNKKFYFYKINLKNICISIVIKTISIHLYGGIKIN